MLFRCSTQEHRNCCNGKASAYYSSVPSWASGEKRSSVSSVARVSTVGRKGEQESRFLKNEYKVRTYVAPVCSTAVKNTLDYSTRNGKFKRLEPHFQLSATRSASKAGTEIAVALPHSRERTKEPIPALPNYGSQEKFGARAELRNVI